MWGTAKNIIITLYAAVCALVVYTGGEPNTTMAIMFSVVCLVWFGITVREWGKP